MFATSKNITEYDGSGPDGNSCSVELATKQYYRFYTYPVLDESEKKIWQVKNFTSILKLIENEFGEQLYKPWWIKL